MSLISMNSRSPETITTHQGAIASTTPSGSLTINAAVPSASQVGMWPMTPLNLPATSRSMSAHLGTLNPLLKASAAPVSIFM